MNTLDIAIRDRLLQDHLPLVRRLCRRFSYTPEPVEDLLQIGSIGLLKAIKTFDSDQGSDFLAFAVPLILGEITNYFRDHGWGVEVPRKLQMQRRMVVKAVEALTYRFKRAPTIAQIVEATGLSEEEVYDTFEVENDSGPLSVDASQNENTSGEHTLWDTQRKEDPHLDPLEVRIYLNDTLHCLNDPERTIMYLKFYAGLSQTKIAKRLNISQLHVSRLQRNALEKIRVNRDSNENGAG